MDSTFWWSGDCSAWLILRTKGYVWPSITTSGTPATLKRDGVEFLWHWLFC